MDSPVTAEMIESNNVGWEELSKGGNSPPLVTESKVSRKVGPTGFSDAGNGSPVNRAMSESKNVVLEGVAAEEGVVAAFELNSIAIESIKVGASALLSGEGSVDSLSARGGRFD